MKSVRINEGKTGLVFRNGNYNRVITSGTYWIWPNETLYIYDMSKPFHSAVELNLLLKDEKLASMLEVVEVRDTEIVLHQENGNFKEVLSPGRYAFWKGVVNHVFTTLDLSDYNIPTQVPMHILTRKELLSYIRVYTVEAFEKGVLLVDGHFSRVLEPGAYFFWKNPVVLSVLKADLRQQQLELTGQEILTRDKAMLRMNFYIQYQVVDIQQALLSNKDYDKQLYVLAQLALREYVGTLTLDELLEKKDAVAAYVRAAVGEAALALGVALRNAGVRDIILPGDVKDILNQVLIAQKKAEANVIMRREETASTRSLLNTAKLMEDNAMLFKLKEMEYVEKIADKVSSISLSGNSQLLDQLKTLLVPQSK